MGSYTTSFKGDLAKYDGYFQFDWTEKPLDTPGQTEISWTLYAKGRVGYESTSLTTTASVSVNNKQVWSISNKLLSYSNKSLASGSFIVYHNNDGSGSIPLYISVSKKYYAVSSPAEFQPSLSVANNKPYTICYWESGASVTIEQSYIVPGDPVTVQWSQSKAMPGIGMEIEKFWVEYKIGENGGWLRGEADGSEAQLLFTSVGSPNDRGKPIYFRVKAISSVGEDYNSDYITSGASYINIKLSAPTVQTYTGQDTNNIFQNRLDSLTFTCAKPTKPTNQQLFLCYSVNNGEEIRTEDNSFTIDGQDQISVKVRAYDGAEYSDYAETIVLKRNTNELIAHLNGLLPIGSYQILSQMPSSQSEAAKINGYTCTIGYSMTQREEDGGKILDRLNDTQQTTTDWLFDIRQLVDPIISGKHYSINITQQITDGVDTYVDPGMTYKFYAPTLSLRAAKQDGTVVIGTNYFDGYYVPQLDTEEPDEWDVWPGDLNTVLKKTIKPGESFQEIYINQRGNEVDGSGFLMRAERLSWFNCFFEHCI